MNFDVNLIKSIRSQEYQESQLNIEEEYLHRHAYHKIRIVDDLCQIVLESKVFGESSYASGFSKTINATYYNSLEHRTYAINEYIENGWL